MPILITIVITIRLRARAIFGRYYSSHNSNCYGCVHDYRSHSYSYGTHADPHLRGVRRPSSNKILKIQYAVGQWLGRSLMRAFSEDLACCGPVAQPLSYASRPRRNISLRDSRRESKWISPFRDSHRHSPGATIEFTSGFPPIMRMG